ncbi:MAG TPA: tetratricopeptide repeat protein [Alphaproteobacteria bacterium]|nr:tetratricopeptide repeat protein [Alphaproteobacteria bacterium]
MLSTCRLPLILSALLAAAVLAVYAPVAHYDFIALDDADYVKNNEIINHGFSWSGVKWSFENIVSGNWHPITMLSHMADCQIYGLSAGGQHVTNVLLHLANTLLLFWLLLALTERRKTGAAVQPATAQQSRARKQGENKAGAGNATYETPVARANIWPCALVAALFALHPLHVESVAWIAERKDVLSAFFALLTLLCYAKYVEMSRLQKRIGLAFYFLALFLFALGLMSKSMLVTLPFVMLLLDFWPLQRFNISMAQRLIIEKIPFLILTTIFSIITFLVQRKAGAVVALKYFPVQERLANAMVAYMHYLEKTFWPSSLAMLYPYHHWSSGQITVATILFIGLSLLAVWAAPLKPYVYVGWLWFVGMLVPVIGIVQVGLQSMADHYTYLPLIGIFIALAWGLADLANDALRIPQLGCQPLLASAAVLAIVCLSVASAIQVCFWRNSETLFNHAISITGHNTVAHYILGALYDSQGKSDAAATQFTEAIDDDPGNVKARCGLGYIFCSQGKLDEAAQQYQIALRIAPDLAKAHFGLGDVLMKQHDFDHAMSEYSLALQSNPNIPEAHYQMAALFSAKGDPASAISQLEEAVQLAPDWPLALNNLAWMRATEADSKLRDGNEAARLAMRAVVLTGKSNPSTLDTLAAAYAETGKFPDATATAKTAIETASAADETNLVQEIQSRLKLYQSQQPYRE